jgi:hypothetical protein
MPQDPARSYQGIADADLARLGRVADEDVERFFSRNAHVCDWRSRLGIVALAQGAAEHRLRGTRGIWDLDIIITFCSDTPRQLRRMVVSWDWGPSKFGRCPYDPPEYTGRAVDVKYWVTPERSDPVEALREWLQTRLAKHPDPRKKPDVAHEPVILIRPSLGGVVWDPGVAPSPRLKTVGHRRPHGLAPP